MYQPTSYLYLVDEVTMLLNSATTGSSKSTSYPIELEISQNMVMNIDVMKALAKAGFEGLANLLDFTSLRQQLLEDIREWIGAFPG